MTVSARNGGPAAGNGEETRHKGGGDSLSGPPWPVRLWKWLRGLFVRKGVDHSLRHTLEEIIEEASEGDGDENGNGPISNDERVMLANILKQRRLTAYDIMVPRADIVGVDVR